MLPPKRSTRTSLTGLGVSKEDEERNSDETSTRSETPVRRQPRKTSSPNRTGDMQKKSRRKLTSSQKQALEEHAARDINPSLEERRVLASEIGL